MRVEGPGAADDPGTGGPPSAASEPSEPLRPYGATGPAPPAPEPVPEAFVSPSGRLRAAQVGVVVATVGAAADALGSSWALAETLDAVDREPAGTAGDLDALDLPQNVVDALNRSYDVSIGLMVLSVVLLLGAAVPVIRWQSVAIRNQRAFGVRTRTSPTAAGWSWFVPVWCLFGPKRVFNDLWRSSEPDGASRFDRRYWQERSVPAIFFVWWAAWIAANVLGGRSAVVGSSTLGDRQSELGLAVGSAVSTLVGGLVFLWILTRITARHDALGAPPGATGGVPRSA